MNSIKIKNNLKYFLTYSRSERNGTIVLSVILLILLVATIFLQEIVKSESITDSESYEKIDSFFNSLEYVVPNEKYNVEGSFIKEELPINRDIKLFYFNPNTVSLDSLINLGLSAKQAQVVINYRNKGGRFITVQDLSKIHVIDSATFNKLKPWVRIPTNSVNLNDSIRSDVASTRLFIELNSSDSISLTKIKGIGRSYARRIVAYRNLIGGFYSIKQLSEVYGLNSEIISSIQPYIWVDSTLINRININVVGYEELRVHPYLTDYQAKSIIYYRSKKGSFVSIYEILENKLLPEERFNKIKQYLTLK